MTQNIHIHVHRRGRDAETRNPGYGFSGGATKTNGPAVFAKVREQLQSKFGLKPEEARDFLDSTYGRHLSDELDGSADLSRVTWLARAVREWKRKYDPSDYGDRARDASKQVSLSYRRAMEKVRNGEWEAQTDLRKMGQSWGSQEFRISAGPSKGGTIVAKIEEIPAGVGDEALGDPETAQRLKDERQLLSMARQAYLKAVTAGNSTMARHYKQNIERHEAMIARLRGSSRDADFPQYLKYKGAEYSKTGKMGTDMKTSEKSAEYAELDDEGRRTGNRLWRTEAGRITEDGAMRGRDGAPPAGLIASLKEKVRKGELTANEASKQLAPYSQAGASIHIVLRGDGTPTVTMIPGGGARDHGGPFPSVKMALRDARMQIGSGEIKLSKGIAGMTSWKLIHDGEGEYGVRWRQAAGRGGNIATKEKFFKTEEQREKFANKLEEQDGFIEFLAWSQPRTGDAKEDYVTRQKREQQSGRKDEVRQIKAELAKAPNGPDAGWMKNRLAQLEKEISQNKAFDAEPQITQSDLNAAARGLNMLGMSPMDLEDLIKEFSGKPAFASKVVVMAAKQMLASKRRMGARDGGYFTCPECEANFAASSLIGGDLPPHKFLGKPCPGAGSKARDGQAVQYKGYSLEQSGSAWYVKKNGKVIMGMESASLEEAKAHVDYVQGNGPRPGAKDAGDVRIVHNRLLGGWYIVRGPHQTPISGRFDSKEEAQAHLNRNRGR